MTRTRESDPYGHDLPHDEHCDDCNRYRAARYIAALKRKGTHA